MPSDQKLIDGCVRWLAAGGGGSPVKPLIANSGDATELNGMDGVVVNQSLLDLCATG